MWTNWFKSVGFDSISVGKVGEKNPRPKKMKFWCRKKRKFLAPAAKKNCTHYGVHISVYDLQTHIGGRHPVLYLQHPENTEIKCSYVLWAFQVYQIPSEIVYHFLTLFQCSKWRNWSFSKCKQEIRYLAEIGPVRHIFDFSLYKFYHFKELWIL